MRILCAALLGLILLGCGKAPDSSAAPAAPDPTAPVSNYKPMSNDEIISETHKCESAGLNAESLKVEKLFGAQTILIQCYPKQLKETK